MSRTRILTIVALASAATTMFAGQAIASAATLYVSHTASANGSDMSCVTAAYSTVQGAVNAANASKVYLCGTAPYYESVLVQKNLQLTGDPGATIQAPANAAVPGTFFSDQGLQTPNSVLTVLGASNVQVNGLTFEGPFQNAGCGGDDFGILQLGTGQVQLTGDTVVNIEAADQAGLGGCQYGVGIQIGRRYWPNDSNGFNVVNFAGNAQIKGTSVSGYQKNGITVDGPGSKAQIGSTTIDGGGQTAVIARNGVQISRGATAQVNGNSINNNEYTGTGTYASATAILIYGGCGDPLSTNVQANSNTLNNNDVGVDVFELDPSCSTAPSTATGNQVNSNVISKGDGESNQSGYDAENAPPAFASCAFSGAEAPPCQYNGYQVGVQDTGNNDQVNTNKITGTVIGGTDTAYGPQTASGGAFLAPVDVQTYPPVHTQAKGNTFDGKPTSPPY